jgi:hypothetical protein
MYAANDGFPSANPASVLNSWSNHPILYDSWSMTVATPPMTGHHGARLRFLTGNLSVTLLPGKPRAG